jgi:multidrug efflux system membrane fusion protein
VVLAALGYFGYRYFEGSRQQQRAAQAAAAARMARRAVPVSAVTARIGDIPVYLRGLGTVTPFNSVTVKTRVDGQLIAIRFQEGQFVKQGQPLAEIDPRPFQVQLEQAQGQLAKDEAQRNDAKVNLQRYEYLWKQGVIAKQQYDTQAATVGQFDGAIAADEAAINNAKLQLTYSHITAPISGRIGLRLVDMGNMVHATDTNGLAIIDQLQPIAVLFTIPADNLPPVLKKLHAGARLPVDAYDRADANKIAGGSLLTVDNQIDPTTGTSRMKAVFANQDSALFPNQFVNCRLLIDTRHGAVIVPASAIQRGPQGTYVYVVKPDKTAEMRQATIDFMEGNEVAVATGVSAGDLVVVDGQDKLQQGTRVDVHVPNRPPGPRRARP